VALKHRSLARDEPVALQRELVLERANDVDVRVARAATASPLSNLEQWIDRGRRTV
jgi:hypothetical protein